MSLLLSILSVSQLRNKLYLTFALILVYRLGFSIVVPTVDQDSLFAANKMSGESGVDRVMGLLSLLSASNVSMLTVFGLGIMPYISASIVFQLLGTVYPPLEALQKEGDAGRKKINELTRYAAIVLCFIQSFFMLRIMGAGADVQSLFHSDFSGIIFQLHASLIMTCGAALLMWMSEQIDEFGIGNGVSLLIMAGILSRVPEVVRMLGAPLISSGLSVGGETGVDRIVTLAFVFVAVVMCVIYITQAQRKIPLQSARHARSAVGGVTHFLPLKLNQSGVMPVIFASSLMMFPSLIVRQLAQVFGSASIFGFIESELSNPSGFLYSCLYVFLIFFFSFFWSAITFNPTEVASNLKDYGSFVPGYRPGERTAAFLEAVVMRVTYVGACFLSVIAVLPTVAMSTFQLDFLTASFLGGTGLLICVSVAIDVAQKIDGYLLVSGGEQLLKPN